MYIGIDNGIDGGIVGVSCAGEVLKKVVMPVIGKKGKGKREYDLEGIRNEISTLDVKFCVLEKAQAFSGQGVTSTFNTGKGYGMMQGMLTALDIPYAIVAPKTWQKELFKGLNSDDTKAASELAAKRMFPGVDWTPTERSKKSHSGLTDAACMAEYCRRIYG